MDVFDPTYNKMVSSSSSSSILLKPIIFYRCLYSSFCLVSDFLLYKKIVDREKMFDFVRIILRAFYCCKIKYILPVLTLGLEITRFVFLMRGTVKGRYAMSIILTSFSMILLVYSMFEFFKSLWITNQLRVRIYLQGIDVLTCVAFSVECCNQLYHVIKIKERKEKLKESPEDFSFPLGILLSVMFFVSKTLSQQIFQIKIFGNKHTVKIDFTEDFAKKAIFKFSKEKTPGFDSISYVSMVVDSVVHAKNFLKIDSFIHLQAFFNKLKANPADYQRIPADYYQVSQVYKAAKAISSAFGDDFLKKEHNEFLEQVEKIRSELMEDVINHAKRVVQQQLVRKLESAGSSGAAGGDKKWSDDVVAGITKCFQAPPVDQQARNDDALDVTNGDVIDAQDVKGAVFIQLWGDFDFKLSILEDKIAEELEEKMRLILEDVKKLLVEGDINLQPFKDKLNEYDWLYKNYAKLLGNKSSTVIDLKAKSNVQSYIERVVEISNVAANPHIQEAMALSSHAKIILESLKTICASKTFGSKRNVDHMV